MNVYWTKERIEEALQRADIAATVELPIEQFRELLEIAHVNAGR